MDKESRAAENETPRERIKGGPRQKGAAGYGVVIHRSIQQDVRIGGHVSLTACMGFLSWKCISADICF
jgi:hypothetical protein